MARASAAPTARVASLSVRRSFVRSVLYPNKRRARRTARRRTHLLSSFFPTPPLLFDCVGVPTTTTVVDELDEVAEGRTSFVSSWVEIGADELRAFRASASLAETEEKRRANVEASASELEDEGEAAAVTEEDGAEDEEAPEDEAPRTGTSAFLPTL